MFKIKMIVYNYEIYTFLSGSVLGISVSFVEGHVKDHLSRVMIKPDFCTYAKTKPQISALISLHR